jgi:hypothetical protein
MAKKKNNGRNIAKEFHDYFGNESNLINWQMLCQDLSIGGDISSINKCKAVLTPLPIPLHNPLASKERL